MKEQSKIYDIGERQFRYNYKKQLLELIFEGEVINAIGLSKQNWEENKKEYMEIWNEELNEELRYQLQYL